jgi:uncharacterized membrane protein
MSLTRGARWTTLGGWFGLVVLIVLWHGWLFPPIVLPRAWVLSVALFPLALPARGLLLQGRPYTHAWSGFIALLYFTHGIMEAWANPAERFLAWVEIVLSLMMYGGAVGYARWRSREMKAAVSQRKEGA